VQLAGVGAPSASEATQVDSGGWHDLTKNGWYDPLKTLLAAVGLTAITLRLLKTIR